MNSSNSSTSVGEVGEIVLYVCPGAHNAAMAVCEPGDVHAAVVGEVLNRDSNGLPVMALLALLTPRLPTVQWVAAWRAHRDRDAGAGEVIRLTRGAPPSEAASGRESDGVVQFQLDFPVGSLAHPQ